jgi:3-methyladenine DNA glycosylase AlkD
MSSKIIRQLQRSGSGPKARILQSFFKTGPGEYGEGDKFLGVTVPACRKIAKANVELSAMDLRELLINPYHEVRLTALLILVEQYEQAQDPRHRQRVVSFYLKNRKGINNWDLVDLSSYKILGDFCLQQGDLTPLKKLLNSKRHWDRRMAIVATLAFTRAGDTTPTFTFAEQLLKDKEDLMHKATGWMLREAGKRDRKSLLRFIRQHVKVMPRTMLRYAIEKFSPEQRKMILQLPN